MKESIDFCDDCNEIMERKTNGEDIFYTCPICEKQNRLPKMYEKMCEKKLGRLLHGKANEIIEKKIKQTKIILFFLALITLSAAFCYEGFINRVGFSLITLALLYKVFNKNQRGR